MEINMPFGSDPSWMQAYCIRPSAVAEESLPYTKWEEKWNQQDAHFWTPCTPSSQEASGGIFH